VLQLALKLLTRFAEERAGFAARPAADASDEKLSGSTPLPTSSV